MSAEEVRAPGKPEPHVYEAAASRVDADPADCVVIEDSPNGIRSAVDAGTHCVAYRGASNADLDLSYASEVVDSPGSLRARLDALLAE
jgi:beta-phosphoglucomutase-like phosphatase (HAD superfamily)